MTYALELVGFAKMSDASAVETLIVFKSVFIASDVVAKLAVIAAFAFADIVFGGACGAVWIAMFAFVTCLIWG
jgi:hypothetical protein